ncbi:hypothetical protein ABNQ39_22605 [Azospirillum sp. A26]|uniref:hypothetical protein n=1 Tax=Azospirillum sp. A26 TaxID=3160607 RepID=UPI00366E6B8C
MARPFDHYTDDEINAWLQAWRATRHGLEDARMVLEIERADLPDGAEKQRTNGQINEINQRLEAHDQLKIAFYANLVALVPPPAATVDKLTQMANRVDDLIGQAKAGDRAVQLAITIVQLFTSATGAPAKVGFPTPV